MLKIAAGNHLGLFGGEVKEKLVGTIFVLILIFLPAIITFFLTGVKSFQKLEARIFAQKKPSTIDSKERRGPRSSRSDGSTRSGKKKRLKNSAVVILSLILALIGFFLSTLMVALPSKADVTPKMLYNSDSDFNEQVEQLGLLTMLRLDIKHMIWPAKGGEGEADPPVLSEPEPVPEAVYNVMPFDFEAMETSGPKKDIQWLISYFKSRTGTKQNAYTGKLKGHNVIFITVEGLSGYAISPEYTPTLYKMSHECFVFPNFYTALHFTSTSNGECQNLLGLYPKNGSPITMTRTGELKTNCYFSLAQQLGRLGYLNLGYHNNYDLYGRNVSHTNLGYKWLYAENGLYMEKNKSGKFLWPQKDSVMIDHTVEDYVNSEMPFNVYYITISGHTPYGWNYATASYKEALADAPYSEKTKGYIGSIMEMDTAMENLLAALKEAGELEKTLIVAVSDHIPYGSVDIIEELAGKKFGSSEALTAINESDIDFDVYKSSLIMWSGGFAERHPVIVEKVCCQVDILPTISNLLGLEYDSRMLAGSDLLSDEEGMVVFSSRCWKTDRGLYNRFTQTFTPVQGAFENEDEMNSYVEAMKKVVANKLDCTARIVENNFYNFAIKYLSKEMNAAQ
jgi:lipoteichoic acid synthase